MSPGSDGYVPAPGGTGAGRELVVEADGGSRGNPGPAGFGALVLDARTDTVLAEVAESIGRATNSVAEYRGLIAGLLAARAVDPDCRVEVRMDSKLVVEQMSGRWKIKNDDLRVLAREAERILPPGQVTYGWIPRARNSRADRLANEAMDAAAAGRSWGPRPDAAAAEPGVRAAVSRAPADTGDPTTLVLIRHGHTELTSEGRFAGADGPDPGLSPRGERAVASLVAAVGALGRPGAFLEETPRPLTVITSPLRRARETAECLARDLGTECHVEPDLRETSFGEWEGLTYGEVTRRWPAVVARWHGATDVAPPGGESLDQVGARVSRVVRGLVDGNRGGCVAVVTHVTPIRVILRQVLEAGPAGLWRMRVDPCALTVTRSWGDGGAEVLAVNVPTAVQLAGG